MHLYSVAPISVEIKCRQKCMEYGLNRRKKGASLGPHDVGCKHASPVPSPALSVSGNLGGGNVRTTR
jgi:hypothetical protein